MDFTQNGCHYFQPSSYHHVLNLTDCFSCFLSHIPPNSFSIWVSSSQSEHTTNLLLIHFYHWTRHLLRFQPRLSHSFLPYSRSSSLSPDLFRLSFSHTFLSLPPSCGWPLNLVRKHFAINLSPVGWGCRIYWVHLCRGVRPLPHNECPGDDTKQSDGEVSVMLELCGMRSTL